MHQRYLQRLHCCCRDFSDLSFSQRSHDSTAVTVFRVFFSRLACGDGGHFSDMAQQGAKTPQHKQTG